MDALIGIYISIIIISLATGITYIWYTLPYWNSMEENNLRNLLHQAKQTTAYLEQALKIAEAELAPLKKQDEEITIERYKRGERDFDWQR